MWSFYWAIAVGLLQDQSNAEHIKNHTVSGFSGVEHFFKVGWSVVQSYQCSAFQSEQGDSLNSPDRLINYVMYNITIPSRLGYLSESVQ